MKKRSYLFVALSAIIALSMLLAACSPTAPSVSEQEPQQPTQSNDSSLSSVEEAETPVTISFWHAYNADVEAVYLEETLIPEFEAANPDVKVESVLVPYDQFRRKLLIALSGGTAPDLARVDIIWVPELADQGALANLEEVIPDFATYSEQFLPGPLSTNLYNGKHYGLPLDTNTRVMVYNKDMFAAAGIEKAPETMAEFLNACEKIKTLGDDKYCFADGGTYAWAVNPWIWSFGGDVTDESISTSSGVFNGANTVAAYQFLKDNIDNGYMHPGMLGGGVDSWGGFGTDQIAML
jgi:multiple sugar transport system substrate-binding protein